MAAEKGQAWTLQEAFPYSKAGRKRIRRRVRGKRAKLEKAMRKAPELAERAARLCLAAKESERER